MRIQRILCGALAAFAVAGIAQAGVVTPAGLNPGDQFRLVFVSSTTTNAEVRDSSVYDQFVSDLASVAGLNTYGGQTVNWFALVSVYDGVATNAIDRLPNSNVPLYTVTGNLVADVSHQIWSGNLLRPINVTEGGVTLTSPSNATVFTGTGSDGEAAQCLDIGNGCTGYAEYGLLTAADSKWVESGNIVFSYQDSGPTGAQGHYYAYSSVLTAQAQGAPSTPEPSTWLTMGCAVAGAFFFRRQRKA